MITANLDLKRLSDYWDKVLKHYGRDNQLNKAQEEAKEFKEIAELIAELITRHKAFTESNSSNLEFSSRDIYKFRLVEESADVCNMIGQLFMVFDIPLEELLTMMQFKMCRTMSRIKLEKTAAESLEIQWPKEEKLSDETGLVP